MHWEFKTYCEGHVAWLFTPSGTKTGLFWENYRKVNMMAVAALDPCVTRASAAMVLTMELQDDQILVFPQQRVQQPLPFHF